MTANPPFSAPDSTQNKGTRNESTPNEGTPYMDTSRAVRQLKRQTFLVISAGFLLLSFASGLGYFSLLQHEKTQTEWSQHNQAVIALNKTLAEFDRAIGYGGLIHNFKNLVLRRDIATYGPLIEKSIAESLQSINKLESLSAAAAAAAADSQDFVKIRTMLKAYQEKYALARTMIQAGEDSAAIDAAVRVSDTEALVAIKHLSQNMQSYTQAIESAAEQKNLDAEKLLFISGATLIVSVILAMLTLFVYVKRIMSGYQTNARHQQKITQQAKDLERAFTELKATEERYTLALDGSGDGVWDWDIAANKVYLSRRWKTMLGHEEDEIGTELNEWSSRLHPGDMRRVMADVQDNLEGNTESFTNEHRVRCKDGSYLWILDRGKVVARDAEGKPLRMVGTHTDISAQKIATRALEAALRDSSALLTALNMHAIVSVADSAGNIIEVNDAFCNISGYRREELLGKNHRIVNSNVQPHKFWVDMWQDISNGKPWRSQVCNRAKNGSHYWVDTFIAPFINDDGSIEKYISIRTDITAAKQQETKLLSAKGQLEKAADVAEMGIWIWDLTTDTFEWNERMYKIYEAPVSVREQGNQYAHWRSRVHPEDIAFTEERLQQALKGKGTYNPIFRILNSQGKIRYIQAAGFVECNEAGKPIQMMGINRDITQQYETEDVLRKAKQAADDASTAKSEFLANMSHELRTPMNAILGMLTLLKKTELNHRQADYTQKTEGAARSLLGLLNDILDLSKAEAGKMLLDPHPFSLDKVLRDLSVILSTNAGKKPVEVLFDIAADVRSEMVGDAMRLQQVLLNLGSNAIKFTEQGSVILKIEALQKSATAITLKFSVCDTGIGIALENQARIFSGFTQAEASTTRRFGGTGLGVAISQRLVKLMGGQLELTSKLGEGSCFFFTITLPLSAAQPDSPQKMSLYNKTSKSSVLVVDDNPIALDIIAQLSESVGWQTDRASSGEQALSLIKRQAELGRSYSAVFVDWQMPGMDGWQTSLAIHEMDIAHIVPVVVMVTAHDREMLAQRSETEQALIDGFLVKPITASMLVDAVVDAYGHAEGSLGLQHPAVEATTEPRLVGMKILLTEDNLNNQQVARELLEAEGAIVEVANNGQEAVTRVAQLPAFDVVLMDLQMPVMDGFTATKRIRKDLGLTDLPIVAMTANAMLSDKEACIQAGMNDHIGKPFDLHNLINVLRLRAGWEVSQAAPIAVATEDAPYVKAAIAAKVDIASALARLGGKQELYARMFPMFLANLSELPHKLSECLEAEQYLKASQQLHSLKGLAGTMGAMELATQAGLAEKLLAGDVTAAAARLQVLNMNALISEMLPLLGDLLSALRPPVIAPAELTAGIAQSVDEPALLHALENLLSQLNNADMAATHAGAQLQETYGAVLGEHLTPLNAAMANLDFEQAVNCVLDLKNIFKVKGND